MMLAGSCKVYLMKCLFLTLLFSSVLLSIVRLIHHIHPIYEAIQEEGPKDLHQKPWWTPLLANLSQDDLELVGKLKSELVYPQRGNYNFRRGEAPFKEHVLERAVRQLNTLNRGFFVEIGAGDGEKRSPTICLEMEDKWRGLLIEADPRLWWPIKSKKRKVSLALACVGFTNTSYVGMFGLNEPTQSKLIERWAEGFSEMVEVNCYPLYTYFLAIERTVIDFLVVNINGRELDVLQTLPWNRVSIAIVAVCYGTRKERIAIDDFLGKNGYHLYRKYYQDGESFLLFSKAQINDD